MSENTVTDFLKRSKMEELLYDLSLGIVNVDDKRLSEEDVEKLCVRGFAFKLDADHLIGGSYLKSYLLQLLKENEDLDIYVTIKEKSISPFLVSQILNDFVSQSLAIKEGHRFKPNLEVMISEEIIVKGCQYQISRFTVHSITKKLGFSVEKIGKHGIPYETQALMRCKDIVRTLIEKKVFLKENSSLDHVYWNHQ